MFDTQPYSFIIELQKNKRYKEGNDKVKMKILMIGNGFDLEHGLPTKYVNFLDYIIAFRKQYALTYDSKLSSNSNTSKDAYFSTLFSDTRKKYIVTALQAMSKDNLWIDYFIKVRDRHLKDKENWIDFESEISRIIQDLDWFRQITGDASRTEEYYHYKEELREILEQEDLAPDAIKKTIEKLKLELNKLICALEIYLDDYVGAKEITLYNPDIAQIRPDNVISFNYTDTYRKVYGEDNISIVPTFVHGMATNNILRFRRIRLKKSGEKTPDRVAQTIEKNNMVLGIDEYLAEERRNKEIDFIEFKKYYQRIYKKTGNEYKKWLLSNEPKALYIFGHSLDVTDGDILREFLEREDVKATIFYKDQEQLGQQIANLVKILGQNAVIEKAYGNNPSIVFQRQRAAEPIANSEFDLSHDIGRVERLGEMKECEARALLGKIDAKINDKDLEYFGSQVNVIDLFDALQSIGLGEFYNKKLYDIAVTLVDKAYCEPHQFSEEGWSRTESEGIFGVYESTADFIKQINSINRLYQNAHMEKDTDEEDIFSKYEYLVNSDGEINAITLRIVWTDFQKAFSEENYSQKELWDFLCSIILEHAERVADETLEKLRKETNDPIEIVRLTRLLKEVEKNMFEKDWQK